MRSFRAGTDRGRSKSRGLGLSGRSRPSERPLSDNILGFETRESIEREAREWLIRLDGDMPLSDTENTSLQSWLNRHPSHRAELERLSKFWQSANVLTELAVPLKKVRTQNPVRTRTFLIAASVILVSTISAFWWRHTDYAANGTYRTVTGQQQIIALPDGSSIELNTDSLVRVDYARASRNIRLLRGEALFSVAHSTLRPFDVYAASQVGLQHAKNGDPREDAYAVGGDPVRGRVFLAVAVVPIPVHVPIEGDGIEHMTKAGMVGQSPDDVLELLPSVADFVPRVR